MNYQATDADLPPIFWPDGKAPAAIVRAYELELKRFTGVHLYYPAPLQSQLEKQKRRADRLQEIANRKDAKDEELENRRIYVKAKKVAQMNIWLTALYEQGCGWRMKGMEKDFFTSQHRKFGLYFPKMKWVTWKQFQLCEALAMKYLDIGNTVP